MARFKDLQKKQQDAYGQILMNCPNMDAMLKRLIDDFKLTESKPGLVTKNAIVYGLINNVLPMINPELK